MKARKDLENELRMAREASISIMENKEVSRRMWERKSVIIHVITG